MAATKKISVYFDRWRMTSASEILSGVQRYIKMTGSLNLGAPLLWAVHSRPSDLAEWNGDGVIGFFYDRGLVESLWDRKILAVNLTAFLSPFQMPVVVSDNEQIGRIAADHLLDRGFRRFAFVGRSELFSNQRLAGFMTGLGQKGIDDRSVETFDLPHRRSVQELSSELSIALFSKEDRPVGIFAADDDIAATVLAAVTEMGRHVPKQVGIMGANDMELICNSTIIPLTSIAFAYPTIGFEAAKLLDELLQGNPVGQKVVRVPPLGLVPRMSTRTFAVEDPLVEEALTFIHANISKPFNVADVVTHCGKSRRNTEMRFMQAMGHTMLDEIMRARVERAKPLLTATEWTISRIAEQCGFGSSQRLREAFQRIEGALPNSFREV